MNGRLALLLVLAALLAVPLILRLGSSPGSVNAESPPSASETNEAGPASEPRTDGFVALSYRVEDPVRSFEAPETVLEDGADYRAELHTSAGTLLVDLYQDATPVTVNNFVFLALHRYYQQVPFHRVLDDFMAQTGDPTGTGSGGPGYTFEDEIREDLRHDRPGLLSMANAGPGTNGSQFFLTFVPTPWLDGGHTVFGEVLEGHEVLDALTRIDPNAPSVVAMLDDPVSSLREQGVHVPEDEAAATVGAWLDAQVAGEPGPGDSFRLGERRGVIGTVGGALAVGLYPVPDTLEQVVILTAPRHQEEQE